MAIKDRLGELQNFNNYNNVYNETVEIIKPDSIESTDNDEIISLFDDVNKIRSWINEIEENTRTIKNLYSNPTFQHVKILQDEVDSKITLSNGLGLKVTGALRQFEQRIKNTYINTTESRIARLQYATMRQNFSNALEKHEQFLQTFKENQYALLQEQIKLTNLTITDEECQSLLDSNKLSLFVDNLQAETQEARLALRDVEERHQELLKIENSIREVNQLFLQMSFLVAQQQDLIDTVEFYANQASANIELGGKELNKGSKLRKKARKKKIGLILCVSIGVVILLLILLY